MPSIELPDDLGHVRVQVGQHLALSQSALSAIELLRVAATHALRRDLALQEGIELDGAEAVLQDPQAQVRVLVIATTPAVGRRVLDQEARVDPRVQDHRRDSVGGLAEGIIVEARQRHVLVTIDEHLCDTKDCAALYLCLDVAVQAVEGIEIVIHHPMTLGTRRRGMVPDEVARSAWPDALVPPKIVAGVVLVEIALGQDQDLRGVDDSRIVTVLLLLDDNTIRHAHMLERLARQSAFPTTL